MFLLFSKMVQIRSLCTPFILEVHFILTSNAGYSKRNMARCEGKTKGSLTWYSFGLGVCVYKFAFSGFFFLFVLFSCVSGSNVATVHALFMNSSRMTFSW